MSVASKDTQVVRVVFQILKSGDLLKMDAISNVSPTGGGARDLRFRPASEFLPIFRKMLPEVVLELRGGAQIETYRGPVIWEAEGKRKSGKMTVWPATSARPNECRIAKVNQFDFTGLVKKDPAGRASIFMLFQQKNGVVRAYFTTETSFRSENWNSTVKNFVIGWLATTHRSAFLDLKSDKRFPS